MSLSMPVGGGTLHRTLVLEQQRARAMPHTLAALALASLAGCSLVLDADGPQCEVDADCAARGVNFAGAVCQQNLCVVKATSASDQKLTCGSPTSNGLPTVSYAFAMQVSPSSANAATVFRVQACEQFDVDCKAPVAGPFDVPAGTPHEFSLPQGFAGFFQITSAATLPALYFMARPVVADTIGWSPTILSSEVVAQLAGAAGVALEPMAGVLIASVRDCDGAPVSGASVSASEEQAIRYYVVNNLPVLTAKETSVQGAVGFANVPATTVALNGVSKSGVVFPPVSVRIKSGSLSLVEIQP